MPTSIASLDVDHFSRECIWVGGDNLKLIKGRNVKRSRESISESVLRRAYAMRVLERHVIALGFQLTVPTNQTVFGPTRAVFPSPRRSAQNARRPLCSSIR